jgi:hypothetical protein
MTPNETTTSSPEKLRWRPLIGLGIVALILAILACVAFYHYIIRGASGEPADRDTVQRITVEFVSALQSKDYPTAKDMFSEANRDSISIETLETLASESSIVTYQSLRVCDFKVFFTRSRKHLAGLGLIQYEDGLIAFESTLLQDPDGTWQLYGFFLTDNDTMSWEACE